MVIVLYDFRMNLLVIKVIIWYNLIVFRGNKNGIFVNSYMGKNVYYIGLK